MIRFQNEVCKIDENALREFCRSLQQLTEPEALPAVANKESKEVKVNCGLRAALSSRVRLRR